MDLNALALWILLGLSLLVPTVLALRTRWPAVVVICFSPLIVATLQSAIQAFLFGVGPMLVLVFAWSFVPALLASVIVVALIRSLRRPAGR